MKYKNVKPTTYNGMKFRSKLEARYNRIFTKFNWDFQYEPEVPELLNYQPDFVIYPKREKSDYLGEVKPIYVEIKPIREITKLCDDPNYDTFREKIYKNWNRENDLILFGGNLFNRLDWSAIALCWQGNFSKYSGGSYGMNLSFENEDAERIGLSWHHAELIRKNDHTYPINGSIGDEFQRVKNYIERLWNESWSDLRWEPKK